VVQIGSTTVGQRANRSFTVKNTGGARLILDPKSVVSNSSAARLTASSVPYLEPNQSGNLSVDFDVIGSTPEVVVQILSNDRDENPFSIRLTTNLSTVGPKLSVSKEGSEVGKGGNIATDLAPGVDGIDVDLVNVGDAELTITNITLDGVENSVPLGSQTPIIKLAPSQSTPYTVYVNPPKRTGSGANARYEVAMTVESDDRSGHYQLKFTGFAKSTTATCASAPGFLFLFPWLAGRRLRRRPQGPSR
jgi:hypothetical protein